MEDEEKREYELAVIVDDAAAERKIEDFLTAAVDGMEVMGREPAKLVELAYPIKKRRTGVLLVYYLRLLPEKVATLRQDINFQPFVLRTMILTKRSDTAAEKTSKDQATKPINGAKKTGVEISSTEELAKTLKELQ